MPDHHDPDRFIALIDAARAARKRNADVRMESGAAAARQGGSENAADMIGAPMDLAMVELRQMK